MANSLLTAELKKINSQKITFIDMNKYIFIDIKEYRIDPIYITVNRFDIHVLWESFLWCFLNKYKTCISSDDFQSLKSILEMRESKFRKYIRKLTSVSYANSRYVHSCRIMQLIMLRRWLFYLMKIECV